MFTILFSNNKYTIVPKIMYGPKGIWLDNFFEFLIKSGITLISANIEARKIINGIEIQPNQKPIAANNFASPKPIPSFFLICL